MLNRNLLETIIRDAKAEPGSSDVMYRLPNAVQSDNLKPAAVLVPLVERTESPLNYHVLLTKRAAHLKHHPGQVSFPGGRQESHDIDLIQTALRETQEEIGIQAELIDVIGSLPRHQTITQYDMTPIVGVVSPHYQLNIDHNEVDSVFEVPLDVLCDLDNYQEKFVEYQGEQHSYHEMMFERYRIWGATARVLIKFAGMINRFDH